MQLGMIGLGRMGANMTTRLLLDKHELVVFDFNPAAVEHSVKKEPSERHRSADLVSKLKPPRAVWIMVPSGNPTDQTINELLNHLSPGDTIIDGGNSNFRDSQKRAGLAKVKDVAFIDAGTSGGVWGLKNGYCLMVGGDEAAVKRVEPIFLVARAAGRLRVRQARAAPGTSRKWSTTASSMRCSRATVRASRFSRSRSSDSTCTNLRSCGCKGPSSVRGCSNSQSSRFSEDPKLASIRGYVDDSGEGRWTVEEAINESVPAPVITMSLISRFVSRQPESYSAKVIAALRNQFGGHAVKHEDDVVSPAAANGAKV